MSHHIFSMSKSHAAAIALWPLCSPRSLRTPPAGLGYLGVEMGHTAIA
jgi:hypothetical protein